MGMSALRAGGRTVIEIEERVDMRHQRGRLARTDPEQQLPACDEQLIAQLELDRKVRFDVVAVYGHRATVEQRCAATYEELREIVAPLPAP